LHPLRVAAGASMKLQSEYSETGHGLPRPGFFT
jgi:hypothetical protein